VIFGKWPTRITVFSLAIDTATSAKSTANELRRVFIYFSERRNSFGTRSAAGF
jgi:hypothetical protein